MAVIDIQNVSKRYLVQQSRQLLLEHAWRKVQKKTDDFWALRNISFQIEEAEKVAFVGPNGAGKSTLLAIISGVTHATEGVVSVRARVAALLALGTGLHPDLTGEENIQLIGSLMGLTREEVRAKFNTIVDFSGLHRFVEAPVRTYSSGMIGRLGFAVAVHAANPLNTRLVPRVPRPRGKQSATVPPPPARLDKSPPAVLTRLYELEAAPRLVAVFPRSLGANQHAGLSWGVHPLWRFGSAGSI